jgi:Fe-S-cluster containining protein
MKFEALFESDELTEVQSALLFNSMFETVWQHMLPQQIDLEGLPAVVSSNAITETDVPVPECTNCGACCAAFVRVPLEPSSSVPEDATWKITAEAIDDSLVVDRFIKRRSDDFVCSRLEGELGVKVSCGIYEDRPKTCRTFEAGSDRCHAIRRAYGLEPFLSIDEMSKAMDRLEERDRMKTSGAPLIDSVRFVKDPDGLVRIEADLTDGSGAAVHEFDPKAETWYRSQFEGRTVAEAGRLVASSIK